MAVEAPGTVSGTRIDWPEVIRRLEETSANPTADLGGAQRVLRERARELAQPAPCAEAGGVVELLEFELSGESYGVATDLVSEIFPLLNFTPLFCTPPFVLGITNRRGKMLSIVDLRRFFELPAVGLSNLNRVVVVGKGPMEFGILADAIAGVRRVPRADLQAPPATFTGIREEFLVGVTQERLALLDLERILADPRLVVHEEVE